MVMLKHEEVLVLQPLGRCKRIVLGSDPPLSRRCTSADRCIYNLHDIDDVSGKKLMVPLSDHCLFHRQCYVQGKTFELKCRDSEFGCWLCNTRGGYGVENHYQIQYYRRGPHEIRKRHVDTRQHGREAGKRILPLYLLDMLREGVGANVEDVLLLEGVSVTE